MLPFLYETEYNFEFFLGGVQFYISKQKASTNFRSYFALFIYYSYDSDLFWNHVVECSMESFMRNDYRS